MKRLLFVVLLLINYLCSAQNMSDEQMWHEQIEFLKHDTLPVQLTLLPPLINTPYSEYNGTLLPDSTFYFSSLRPESEDDYADIFEQFWSTRIYQSHLTVAGYSRPTPISHFINDDHYYNCNFTFNSDQTLMVFTRCLRDGGKQLQCSLWSSSRRKTDEHWTKPQQLNRRINLPGSTTTQPHWVDCENYSVMYFVSDRPRGFGELDIWYTIFANGRFEDPVNAGSLINSADNEATPFYDKASRRLYFSCDAPPKTIGGYDIFYSEGQLSQWSAPTNMGVPFNSIANDIYFTINQHDKDGYFASNRPKNPDDDADTCCTDLYRYHWLYDLDTVPKSDTVVADTVSIEKQATLLLPLTLFFHNDEPDPRTTATTTKQNYQTTLANYLAMKEIYKNEYAKGLKGKEAETACSRIESFFADSVQAGYRKLEALTQLLLKDLESGHSVTLTVCGFASPLHKADYNLALSARRIASFVNFLKEYDNGRLLPYFSPSSKVKLLIISEPEGSSKAREEVSDNVNDKRNSVYSIAASKERRIQITRYEVNVER